MAGRNEGSCRRVECVCGLELENLDTALLVLCFENARVGVQYACRCQILADNRFRLDLGLSTVHLSTLSRSSDLVLSVHFTQSAKSFTTRHGRSGRSPRSGPCRSPRSGPM